MIKAILAGIGIMMAAGVSAQSVSFAYDEAGNRIKREMTVTKRVAKSEGNACHDKAFLDMVDGRGIKIRDCGAAGLAFGGMGAIPGAIVGSAFGAVIGGFIFNQAGAYSIDLIYGR